MNNALDRNKKAIIRNRYQVQNKNPFSKFQIDTIAEPRRLQLPSLSQRLLAPAAAAESKRERKSVAR